MVDGREVKSSLSTSEITHENLPASDESLVEIPKSKEKNGNRTKLKWFGSFQVLKPFVELHLNVGEGEWSGLNNSVTISFYPGSRTLSFQGVDQDIVKRRIIHLFGEDGWGRAVSQAEDGSIEDRNVGEGEELEPSEDDSVILDNEMEVNFSGRAFEKSSKK